MSFWCQRITFEMRVISRLEGARLLKGSDHGWSDRRCWRAWWSRHSRTFIYGIKQKVLNNHSSTVYLLLISSWDPLPNWIHRKARLLMNSTQLVQFFADAPWLGHDSRGFVSRDRLSLYQVSKDNVIVRTCQRTYFVTTFHQDLNAYTEMFPFEFETIGGHGSLSCRP